MKKRIMIGIILIAFSLTGCSNNTENNNDINNDKIAKEALNNANDNITEEATEESNATNNTTEEVTADASNNVTEGISNGTNTDSEEQIFSTQSEDGSILINVTTSKYISENKIKEISVIVNGVTLNTIDSIVGYFDNITLDAPTSLAVIKYHGQKWENFSLLDVTTGQVIFYEPFCFEDLRSAYQENNTMNYEINDDDVIEFSCDKILDKDSFIITYQVHDMNENLQSGSFKYIISSNQFEDLQENEPRPAG
jgi:hypothetical protein